MQVRRISHDGRDERLSPYVTALLESERPYRSRARRECPHDVLTVLRSGRRRSAGADCGHDDLRYFLGVGDHDNVRGPFDLGHRRAHTVVAEAVHAGVNTPVGGPKYRPGRAAAPRRGRRGLGERNTGEGALGDRVERGVIGWDVGAE
jgi:hypothetical protein